MVNEARILLVEDDSSIRDFMSIALTNEGYRVLSAENGWVGLSQVASFQPDLIILDMNLPIINGTDFVAVCAGLPQSAPIIGISAMRNGKAIAERAGIIDFLEKPFSLDELFAHITRYLPARDDA
jgi:two-component system KDP operon response regulator KdpE